MQTVHIDPNLAAAAGHGLMGRTKLIRTDVSRGNKWSFDLSRGYCSPGVGTIVNGAVVKNLSESYAERDNPVPAGDMVIASSETLSVSGGGIYFGAATVANSYLRGPATAAAAIWANGQYYLSTTVLKLPTAADWAESTTAILPFHSWTAGVNSYAANLDIASTGFQKSGATPIIMHRRQYGGAFAGDLVGLIPPTAALGGFAMVASWYRPGEIGTAFYYPGGIVPATPIAPTGAHSTDFSALRPLRGLPATIWNAEIANNAHKFKIYAGFDEAIGLSGRSVSAVLAEHWAREKAKWDAGIYS